MPKGTSLNEATSNSEKIKPIALAVIDIRTLARRHQAVSQQKISLNIYFKNLVTNYWKPLGLY